MSAQDPEAAPAELPANAERSNREDGGKLAIAIFVLFVVSLLAFGTAPFTSVSDGAGSRFTLNLLSVTGIVGGLLGLGFLISLVGRPQLTSAKKVLGIIGAVGLLAHAGLAIFSPIAHGGGVAPVGTGGNLVLARSGPESWTIDGETCEIASTYLLQLPTGPQFTIEHPYPHDYRGQPMSDAQALDLAFPLMKYAYEQEIYKRTTVRKLGSGQLHPNRIGVALFHRDGKAVAGHRVALTLEEIRERIEGGGNP